MMEKFKTPLPKCSRGTKWEAPIISIQTEQKAFCSLISPAPRPLPLPPPPWQQRNIWERTPEQSIKPGGRPITCPQQSGPARSTPPGLNLFINSRLLPCIQEAKVALTQPLTLTCSYFPFHRPSVSHPSTHFVLLFQFLRCTRLAWQCPLFHSYPVHVMVGLLGCKDRGRSPAGDWLAYLVSMLNGEQGRQPLSGYLLSRARCHVATACLKWWFTASCFPCSSFRETQHTKTFNNNKCNAWRCRKNDNRTSSYCIAFPFSWTRTWRAQRKKAIPKWMKRSS